MGNGPYKKASHSRTFLENGFPPLKNRFIALENVQDLPKGSESRSKVYTRQHQVKPEINS